MDNKNLIKLALVAKEFSYAPYSSFNVGAALLCKNGKVYTGCNVESASYGATNCAERTALFKAVSEGERDFVSIAVVGNKEGETNAGITAPCGICRQVLYEFCSDDLMVVLLNEAQEIIEITLGELFPHGFGPKNLS